MGDLIYIYPLPKITIFTFILCTLKRMFECLKGCVCLTGSDCTAQFIIYFFLVHDDKKLR